MSWQWLELGSGSVNHPEKCYVLKKSFSQFEKYFPGSTHDIKLIDP